MRAQPGVIRENALRPRAAATAFACIVFLIASALAGASSKFERTYATKGPAHLMITNVRGEIKVSAWDKSQVAVQAALGPSVFIEDTIHGDDIELTTKHRRTPGRADFETWVPADTSVSLKNVIGKVEVEGIQGHVKVDSFDGDVHLVGVRGPSLDVKVTTGDIFFEGDLTGDGPYSLQSMRGDIDVSLPANTAFSLNARSLSEKINLGPFLSRLTDSTKEPRNISGIHLREGPRLTLTTYNGRIQFHRK